MHLGTVERYDNSMLRTRRSMLGDTNSDLQLHLFQVL